MTNATGQQWAETPASVIEVAEIYRCPVVLLDFQISRRKKIHLAYAPEWDFPFAFDRATQALDRAWDAADGVVVILYDDGIGRVEGCRAILSALPGSK